MVEGVRRWWTPDADLGSVVGGTGVFRFYGGQNVTRVEVIELNRPERVVWRVSDSFRPERKDTTIEFTIRPESDGAALLFAHRDFPEPDEAYALCTTGWGIYLGRLKASLEGTA